MIPVTLDFFQGLQNYFGLIIAGLAIIFICGSIFLYFFDPSRNQKIESEEAPQVGASE